MALFGKREKVFEVWGDKPRWKAARRRLKDAGVKIMETGYYETEAPVCGCGAKLDHRDFGPNGRIDRLTYYTSAQASRGMKEQAGGPAGPPACWLYPIFGQGALKQACPDGIPACGPACPPDPAAA